MMYGNKLAIALKVSGKVLRESGDQVYLPFGSEYSVFIKNMDPYRALVSVSIDGKDITDDTKKFVIAGNSSVELERFLPRGNSSQGNRFKFIERTGAVEEHRGIKVEDGILRVEYQFENPPAYAPGHWCDGIALYNQLSSINIGSPRGIGISGISGPTYNSVADVGSMTATCSSSPERRDMFPKGESVRRCWAPEPQNAGITAHGSISEQRFGTASYFATKPEKHVLILRMLGAVGQKSVATPVTVAVRPTCSSCGKVNKATSKFCSRCGTGLQLVA